MSCLLGDVEKTRNLLKNNLLIFDNTRIQKGDVVDLMEAFDEYNNLPLQTEYDENNDRFYTLYDHRFTKSASDVVKERYEARRKAWGDFTVRESKETEWTATGTLIHEMTQGMLHHFYKNGMDADTSNVWNKQFYKKGEFKIAVGANTKEHAAIRQQIENTAKLILTEAQQHQAKINSKTGKNDKFYLRTEQRVINSTKDLIGHQDIMLVFSDKTIWDYDIKTKTLSGKGKKKKVTQRLIVGDQYEDYSMQMLEYKNAKELFPGVKVTRSIIIPMVYTGFVDSKGIMRIRTMYTGNDNLGSTSIATKFSESTNNEVNNVIKRINKTIEDLKTTRSKTDDKNMQDKMSTQISWLFDIMQGIALNKTSIDTIKKYKQMVNILPKENTLSKMNFKALNAAEGEINVLLDINEVFDKIIADEISLNKKFQDKELIKEINNFRKIASPVTPQLEQLKIAIQSEKVKRHMTKTDKSYLEGNTIGTDILKMRDLNLLETMFTGYDYIDNPLIQTVSEINLTQERKALQSYNKKRKVLMDSANKAFAYGDSNLNMNVSEVYAMMVDQRKGSMIRRWDTTLIEDRNKAFENRDVAWLKEHYEITDIAGYRKVYGERLERTKSLIIDSLGGDSTKSGQNMFKDEFDMDGNIIFSAKDKYSEYQKQIKTFMKFNNLLTHNSAWLNGRNLGINTKLKEKYESKYETQEYKRLQQHKPINDFYLELNSLYEELRRVMEVPYNQMPQGFIPNYKAALVEKLDFVNTGASTNESLKEWSKDLFMMDEQDRVTTQFEEGWTEGDIPMVGLVNVDSKLKSYDLLNSALLFTKAAYMHKNLNDTVDEVKSILTLVDPNSDVYNKYVKITDGKKGKQATEVYKTLEEMIGYQWFGRRYKDIDKYGKNVGQTALSVRNYHIMTKMGFSFVSAAGAGIGGIVRARFISRSGVAYNKEQFNKALKGMSNAEDRSKMRAMSEFFNTSAEGQVNRDVRNNLKGVNKWLREEGLMFPWSFGDNKLSHIITGAVSQNYGIDAEGNIKRIDLLRKENPNAKSFFQLFKFDVKAGEASFEGYGDESIPDHTWIQFHKAVRQTMLQAIGQMSEREQMGLQSTVVGTMFSTYKSWVPGVLMGEFGTTQYDHAFRTIKEGRLMSVWKNYAAKGDIEANMANSFIKGLANFTRDFLVDFAYVFSDEFGGDVNKSKAYFQFETWKGKNPSLAANLGADDKAQFAHWMDMRKRNLNAAFAELRIALSFSLILSAGALLGMMGFDDEVEDAKAWAKRNWLIRRFMELFNKMTDEVQTPVNPMELLNVTTPTVPAISLVVNSFKIIANTLDESRDFVFGEESKHDRSAPFHYFRKEIVLSNSFFRLFDQIYDTDIQSNPNLR